MSGETSSMVMTDEVDGISSSSSREMVVLRAKERESLAERSPRVNLLRENIAIRKLFDRAVAQPRQPHRLHRTALTNHELRVGFCSDSCPDDMGKQNFTLKTVKGSRDWAGVDIAVRDKIFEKITTTFKKHGAVSLDTPVFELKEVLAGKYGEDSKLIYDLADQGGELSSLRYDLTVPFARWLAMNPTVTAIKRYHLAKVYRRDQPAVTKGRMREFYQCDFDIAGNYDAMLPDAEILRITVEILDGLNIGEYTIKLNHRQILDGLFEVCGVPQDKIRPISSAVDKLDKSPWEEVRKEMTEQKGLDPDVADKIGAFVLKKGARDLLEELEKTESLAANETIKKGLADMRILFDYLDIFDVTPKISFDLSLARGLDYYTGVIYEVVTELSAPPAASQNPVQTATASSSKGKKKARVNKDDPDADRSDDDTVGVGSIAAGGRYDELVGMFSGKGRIPCVGISFGVDRIYSIIRRRLENSTAVLRSSDVDIYVMAMPEGSGENKNGFLKERMAISKQLWEGGIKAEFLYKACPKMQAQFKAAEVAGVPFAVIIFNEQLGLDTVRIKELGLPDGHPDKEGIPVPVKDLVEEVKKRLRTTGGIEQYISRIKLDEAATVEAGFKPPDISSKLDPLRHHRIPAPPPPPRSAAGSPAPDPYASPRLTAPPPGYPAQLLAHRPLPPPIHHGYAASYENPSTRHAPPPPSNSSRARLQQQQRMQRTVSEPARAGSPGRPSADDRSSSSSPRPATPPVPVGPCQICDRQLPKLTCRDCVRDKLYPMRYEIVSVTLANESLETDVEHAAAAAVHSTAAAEKQDLENTVAGINDRLASLRVELEQHRSYLARLRRENARRQKLLRETSNVLDQNRDISIEKVRKETRLSTTKWNTLYERTAESRVFLCREISYLNLLRQRRRKKVVEYMLNGIVIPDIRHIYSLNPNSISVALGHLSHMSVLIASYLGLKLPCEIVLPARDAPSATIRSPRFLRPRPLSTILPLPQLHSSDSDQYAMFIEGVSMLVYNVAWLCWSQGLEEAAAEIEDVWQPGRNLYRLLLCTPTKHHAALVQWSEAAGEAVSLPPVTAATSGKKAQAVNMFLGRVNHCSAHSFLNSPQGLEHMARWKISLNVVIDRTKHLLVSETSNAEWDLIEDEIEEDPAAKFISELGEFREDERGGPGRKSASPQPVKAIPVSAKKGGLGIPEVGNGSPVTGGSPGSAGKRGGTEVSAGWTKIKR
ncbi:hypothetical protein Dda_1259 [Drechslerella dactyloides]|uniref:Autophagy-related protein 14 n=1 Tax=Drechslerella dactyloides TaxID=74499 RepID=A0AAD6NMW8_DREDA|nr:hypothetical protein Dda_1259 [Drechslerella dactyloides]